MPPATTTRQTPAGIKLDDGYQAKIAFAADPDVSFWEKTVKPPGLDGGDAIMTTTMHNENVHTKAARQLIQMTDSSTTVAYDPNVYNNILQLINVETSITIRFGDGSTLDFYGFLKSFEPNDLAEGNQPEATISIVPTNAHPTTGAETLPVMSSVSGT